MQETILKKTTNAKLETITFQLKDDGMFIEGNSPFYEVFQYDLPYLQKSKFSLFIHPHDVADFTKLIQTILPGEERSLTFRLKKSEGAYRWLKCSVTKNENIIHYLGKDISTQVIHKYFDKKIASIAKETPDFVGIADLFGNALFVNDHGKFMVGMDTNFDVTQLKVGYFHPKWAENELLNVAIPTAMSQGKWQGELALRTSDNKEIPVSAVIISHKDESGEIGYFSCIMRDVSAQKEKERLVQQQRKEYLSLFNLINDSVIIFDAATLSIIECNKTFIKFFGYNRNELQDRIIYDLYEKKYQDDVKQNLLRLKDQDKTTFTTLQFTKSGDYFYVEIIAQVISFFGTKSILWTIKDISKQTQIETKLRLYAEQLQYSNKHLKSLYSKLQKQSDELAQRNQDFIESITYSKKIQNAIFPKLDQLNSWFPENFVFFKPKAIVSGDFYWYYQTEGKIVIAVGDCTGHGVPGAFMSMIGITILNEIVKARKITTPADILRMLNKQVIKTLKQKGVDYESREGMDIAIVEIDQKENKIGFAGANRHLYYIHNNELAILQGNRLAIGGFREIQKDYANHEISLDQITGIYLSSDGFTDQFGGENNRKFSTRRFKDHIQKTHHLPFKEQLTKLQETFENWKGDHDQIDDVLVVGLNPSIKS